MTKNLQTLNIKWKCLISILFILSICKNGSGQIKEPINTDRPDQSDGTYTLAKKSFQLESGFLYGKAEQTYFIHNTMLRYGITASTEARLLFDYGKVGNETGIFSPGISMKQHLISQKNWIPEITAVG